MMLAGFISSVVLRAESADLSGGLGIAFVGMTTVFTGLVLLSFLLPVLERWVKDKLGLHRRKNAPLLELNRSMTREEVAAVSAAIHVHFCLLDQVENMKLTWETHEKPFTPWRLAGRSEHIQESGSLQNRIRSR